MQNRWRSPVVWAAIFIQVGAILVAFGVIDTGQSLAIEKGIMVVLELLVVFGVLNNPTDRDAF